MDGVPVGKELGSYAYQDVPETYAVSDAPRAPDGSCMIVVATDAPLDSRQLERLAWRAFAGMARTGATFGGGSGDYSHKGNPPSRPGSSAGPQPVGSAIPQNPMSDSTATVESSFRR